MKKILDSRRHSRINFAHEQLLNVKEEERKASLAKSECEERIRLLMEELEAKQKEQESLNEDMVSSAKKARYLEEQIKRRKAALSKKNLKPDNGFDPKVQRKRYDVDEESNLQNSELINEELDEKLIETIRKVIREEIRTELAAQIAPLKDIINEFKAENKRTCMCKNTETEAETMSQTVEDHARSMLPLDKDEHVEEVLRNKEIRRAVALLTKELPFEENKFQRISMIRKFLFADSYLLTRNFRWPVGRESIRPLLLDIFDVLQDSLAEDGISNLKKFIFRFKSSLTNSSNHYRKKSSTKYEGHISPFSEKFNIDTEVDDAAATVTNSMFSGEEVILADMVDLNKTDIERVNEEHPITPERRRGKRRRVKMETESQSQSPRVDDDMVNIREDESTQYFEAEMPPA